MIFENVIELFDKCVYGLPNEIEVKGKGKMADFLSRTDPHRILYNALIPFIVAGIEYFFKQIFIIILNYSEESKNKIKEKTGTVYFSDAVLISQGELKIAELISKEYSFQNITAINKAYKKWLNIDVFRAINYSNKIGRRRKSIDNRINDLIQGRHGLIHKFDFDYGLSKRKIAEIFTFILKIFNSFIDYLEKEKSIIIRDDILKIYKNKTFVKK